MAIGDFVAPWIKAFAPVQDWEIGQDLAQRKSQQQAQQQEAASRLRQSQYEFGAEQDYKNRDLQMRGQEKKAADLLHQDQLNELKQWHDRQDQDRKDAISERAQQAAGALEEQKRQHDLISTELDKKLEAARLLSENRESGFEKRQQEREDAAQKREQDRLSAAEKLNQKRSDDMLYGQIYRGILAHDPDVKPEFAASQAASLVEKRKRQMAAQEDQQQRQSMTPGAALNQPANPMVFRPNAGKPYAGPMTNDLVMRPGHPVSGPITNDLVMRPGNSYSGPIVQDLASPATAAERLNASVETPATAQPDTKLMPMPKKEELKKGQTYQTTRGPATWDGEKFVQP
jgi:hypothetical protein